MVNSFTDELTAWSWGAQVFGCRKKMSAIAILDYGGANELFLLWPRRGGWTTCSTTTRTRAMPFPKWTPWCVFSSSSSCK